MEIEGGTNTSVSWPAGIGGKGNEGVSGQVKQTPGALGYVELIYAIQNKMPYADVKNSAGKFVKPTLESVTAAMATAEIPRRFPFLHDERTGQRRLSDRGATWLLVYQQQKDATKGKKLVEFLKWALTKGETMAKDLDYAPLPEGSAAARPETDRRNQNVKTIRTTARICRPSLSRKQTRFTRRRRGCRRHRGLVIRRFIGSRCRWRLRWFCWSF